MSEPLGPGPEMPLPQPEHEVPAETGMLLAFDVWSYSSVIVQVVPEQNEVSGATLTTPPAAVRPTFRVLPSEARFTW